MRLIDADELKGRTTNFDEEGNRIWHKWDIDNAPTIMPKEFEPLAKAIIDVLPAIVEKTVPAIVEKIERPTGEWIPVSERLPDYSGLYLVSIDELVTVADFIGGEHFMRLEVRGGVLIDVDAWMPLPEPYKEGRKNEQTLLS